MNLPKLAEIKVNDFGGSPIAEHNMPCAVCRNSHAVIDLNTGIFHPCWPCQDRQWILVNIKTLPFWVRWFLARELRGEK